MGYGLIHIKGKSLEVLEMGVLHLGKYKDGFTKLRKIFERITQVIDTHHPDELAIEAPFYGKNVQSMLKLGRAQGVSMVAALVKDIPIFEYAPKKIKQSVTGNGNASKEQVAAMLNQVFQYDNKEAALDATDALAVAACHYFQRSALGNQKNYSGWEGFLKDNPKRVR